jgi:hypothetical protein
MLSFDNLDYIQSQFQNLDVTVLNKYKSSFVFDNTSTVEHYNLLSYISTLCSGQTIFDIGTYKGHSALAMSYNPDVKVVSYDIVDAKETLNGSPANVEWKLGDFRQDPNILTSPFILIDTDPHDGVQEAEFHKFFLDNNYKGCVMWDDIGPIFPLMQAWWNSINDSSVLKLDVSSIGHYTGTGILIYN